ncbi:prolyl oligopeptidase family serine peptidase [Bacillus sp. PS06]|uniref:prolyl oligopeptidase family serine peptidase n=1 Tax=Bacillus sp. PS06 TaxID=2764176 RepID=UPI0017843215|nr:prolyl oligopeptidase family serine peptidase [Bacillus sp. PS06]MBD8067567.1 prolyl oligopeptidase family serine peptidase [Bacillus sp. PS06]
MVIIENKTIANIPTLQIVKDQLQHEQLPLIFFYHGFTSAKEHNLHFAYLLAEEGYRVVLPDALYHGERAIAGMGKEMTFKFWEIVLTNIKELAILKEELVSLDLVDTSRIGVIGTSMGAITMFGALTQYDWINTAVSLMGSPHYEGYCRGLIEGIKQQGHTIPLTDEQVEQQIAGLAPFDLGKKPMALKGRPILFWHGRRDEVIPYQFTYDFYQQLLPYYEGQEDKLKFIEDPKVGHKVSREALLETVEWFKRHL